MKPLYLILAFVLGYLLGSKYFFNTKSNSSVDTLVKQKPLQVESKAQLLERAQTKALFYFKKQNAELLSSLSTNQISLDNTKAELKRTQRDLKTAYTKLKSEHENKVAAKKDTGLSETTDTSILNLQNVELLIEQNEQQTDSLILECQNVSILKDSLTAIRDTQIVLLLKNYSGIRDLQKEQALREEALTVELNQTLKSLRRKRIQNSVLSAGMFICSGIFIAQFINR
jgi:hypothetical protein